MEIVPPEDYKDPIDYRINPGEIHPLTPDSSKRVVSMLEKSKLSFLDLRLEIQFGDLPLIVKIIQEDEGMHLVVSKTELLKQIPLLDINKPEIEQQCRS